MALAAVTLIGLVHPDSKCLFGINYTNIQCKCGITADSLLTEIEEWQDGQPT